MKYFILLALITCFSLNSFAQKKTFEVVSYSAPKNWQQQQNDGGIQLSVSDKKTGAYAIAIITKAAASDASANENFNNDWTRLVKSSVQVNEQPTMQDSSNENGWDIVSGSANYIDGNNKGVATLLNATGGGQTVSVLLMTNTQQYQNELLSFIGSIELAKVASAATGNKTSATTNKAKSSSVVGLWTNYILETTGYSINGMPQYTAGYLRKEYAFYPDGTYQFRNKQWLTKVANIVYMYETGTYSVSGNQITITAENGKGGFWSKTNSSKEWGNLIKYSEPKLETITYTLQLINDPTYGNSIVLKSTKPTVRDGGQFNAPGDPYEFHYSKRELESSIDNPPGLKTGFENKSFTALLPSQANSTTTAIANNSPLTGKIWEGNSPEKAGSGNMQYNTGGFFSSQYRFYADGTYRFVNVNAAAFTNSKSLNAETGTWSVNGNQLSITPAKGQNEEWSITGKTSNGNSDMGNRKILETWNKKIKTSNRKLEKYTYTFNIGKNGDRNALILQRSGHTEREGEGKISYYNETTPGNAVMLPAGFK